MRLFGYEFVWRRSAESGGSKGSGSVLDSIFDDTRKTLAGIVVNEKTVLEIPAVASAINNVSRTLASLPFSLYVRTDNGSIPAIEHPVYHVTKSNPCPEQMITGYNFRRAVFANAVLGDVIVEIRRNPAGRPNSFRIMREAWCEIDEETDRLYYVERLRSGKKRVYYPYEVLHIKGMTLDGMVPEDLIATHRDTFALALAANKYGGAFFGNGAHISGVITSPTPLDPDQIKRIKKNWNSDYSGVRKTGKTAILDSGLSYTKIGLTPEEATLTDTRTFQVREIARIFGMPLHLFQDLGDTTFNNIESMSIQFVTLCLRPWAVEFEQELAMKTLTQEERDSEQYFFKLNLNGLLRGDTKNRAEYYTKMRNIGVLNANEIRELEDFNLRDDPGGDTYFEPLNMQADPQPATQQ